MGRLVAEHFLSSGLAHFAVFDLDTEAYFEERRDDFIAALAAAGHVCDHFHASAEGERPADWERQQGAIARWVAELPKPVGILACTDQLAFWLLDACRRAGAAVPEEVAVVGVENDETLCTMAAPPLSSVAFDGDGIGVGDVIKHAGLSRTLLERRMREAIGRTPGAEIHRVRFDEVRRLVDSTDLTLAAIARRCGFKHPHYMAEAFKKHFGMTPGSYRQSRRGG
jgi:LacI family transcriptional regulator